MEREEGVSPVVAVILMVAITVVLAATVWIMTSNYMTSPANVNQMYCTLSMNPEESTSRSVVFTVTLQKPSEIAIDFVGLGVMRGNNYTILNKTGDMTWDNMSADGKWYYQATLRDMNGNNKFDSGDEIVVSIVDTNPGDGIEPPRFSAGDKVYLFISGYNGNTIGYIDL